MQEFYIIGTVHGHTPHEDLADIINDTNPNQVLVELPQDFDAQKIKQRGVVPDEMLFVHSWAVENEVDVACFDIQSENASIFRDDYDEDSPEYRQMLEFEDEVIKKYNWERFNTKEVRSLLETPIKDKIFDQSELERREKEMLENIQEKSIENGRIVIITGADHIDYFHNNLENSSIPLRD